FSARECSRGSAAPSPPGWPPPSTTIWTRSRARVVNFVSQVIFFESAQQAESLHDKRGRAYESARRHHRFGSSFRDKDSDVGARNGCAKSGRHQSPAANGARKPHAHARLRAFALERVASTAGAQRRSSLTGSVGLAFGGDRHRRVSRERAH